jgi:glycosyltransferase involved in cell wall biosynthesis
VTVAICTAGELFGGVERHVLGLCEYGQRTDGRFPLLVLFQEGELARQARSIGLRPVVLGGSGRYDPRLASSLATLFASRDISVVHAHGYKAMVACALARRLTQSPLTIIKTEHGKLEPRNGSLARWARLGVNRAIDVAATRASADVVCYVSQDLAGSYARLHRTVPRFVILNGIDPLHRADYGRPDGLKPGVPNLGIVGRLTAVKGIQYAIRALARPQVPPEVVLNIIGTGPAEGALRREAAALGVDRRVRFLGFRADAWSYLAHFDALLLPSIHEGLPYTVLESMSLETPIISSRVGGPAEVLQHEKTGLLFRAGDVDNLAGLIARVVADPVWARSIGAAAAIAQRRDFTLERMGRQYWDVYAKAAETA